MAALIDWNAERGHPFFFGTEVTVNLSDDAELLDLLVKANFIWVFMGIETPSAESLKETRKIQNLKGSLTDRVRRTQEAVPPADAGLPAVISNHVRLEILACLSGCARMSSGPELSGRCRF